MNELIEVNVGILTIEEHRVLLTLDIARQFPIVNPTHIRWRPMENGIEVPEPILKVTVQALLPGVDSSFWYYLVVDEERGLVWVPPFVPEPGYIAISREHGNPCNVDHPHEVPTVVLVSGKTILEK